MTMINGKQKGSDHNVHRRSSSVDGSGLESIDNILLNKEAKRKQKEDEKLMSQIVSDAEGDSKWHGLTLQFITVPRLWSTS